MPATQPLVVVTGASGAGKTTLCRAVALLARREGLVVGGILSEARVVNGMTVGLDARDVARGDVWPLAERDEETGGPVTGRWHFHPGAFDEGARRCATIPAGALFLIDEIGPLELAQGLGWASLIPRLAAHDGPGVVVVRPALVPTLTAVLATRSAHVIPISADTRASALDAAVACLGLRA